MVIVDGDGERTMIGYRGASETLRLDRQVIEEIEPDWVHVSGYTLLNRGQEKELGSFIKAATSKGGRLPRPRGGRVQREVSPA